MKLEVVSSALAAECACGRVDTLDSFLRESDVLVAKALALSEVAQIARIERRAREALLAKWNVRAQQAAKTAGAVVSGGGSLLAAYKATDVVMNRWASDVSTIHKRNLEDVYRLARRAGHKKATGQTKASLRYDVINFQQVIGTQKAKKTVALAFDLADENAIDSLQTQELMWIGETYTGVAATVRSAVEPKLLLGLSPKKAGELVSSAVEDKLKVFSIPGGFNGSSSKYFEGLAANAITNSRVQGQLGSFARLGVTRYEIVNPMDDRTSIICQHMNGQVFEVQDAVNMLSKLRDAETPEEYKKIHPWLSESKFAKVFSRGSGALGKAGQLFPPYHFRCRSTVDISSDSVSFDALAD